MNKSIGFIFFLIFQLSFSSAQNCSFYKKTNDGFQIDFSTNLTNQNYKKVLDSLVNIGFYTLKLDSVNVDKCEYFYIKGKQFKNIWVKRDSITRPYLKNNENNEWVPIHNLDSLIGIINKARQKKGYVFSAVKINPTYLSGDRMGVQLTLNDDKPRKINELIVVGYPKIAKGFIRQLKQINKNQLYQQNTLKQYSERIGNSPFVEEVRSPQVLFRPDSTLAYLYIKKKKSNFFDGIVGFGNDANGDFRITGNVKVELNNNFNAMESIRFQWQSTQDKSQQLDVNFDYPYWFGSLIGTETQLNLYRKDSTFVNVDFQQKIAYQFKPENFVGADFFYEGSNFVLKDTLNNANYKDYTKNGFGLYFKYRKWANSDILGLKNGVMLRGARLSRKGEGEDKRTQYQAEAEVLRLQKLVPKHYLLVKLNAESLFMQDANFYQNELYRIGGFGSLRGFNQFSVLANSYSIGTLEYRFVPSQNLFLPLFTDMAWVDNKLIESQQFLIGIGTGISFLTRWGVFQLNYAIGKFPNSGFDFQNGKIHIGIISRF